MSIFRKKNLENILRDAKIEADSVSGNKLKKVLTVRDLTFMGIAAVVGAGIFSTIGIASYNGGPGIVFLFVITAITCGFSALCYAEFAGRVPISGSAYTYAYVSFGEITAWIIGWALILEYSIGNIVVAISWSGYFNNLLVGLGWHIPDWLLTDPFTASSNYHKAMALFAGHHVLSPDMVHALDLWNSAPVVAGLHLFMNIPAFVIIVLITAVAYIGIQESKKMNNFMVIFKICVIIIVIIIGIFYVKAKNWTPFLPNGFKGVLAGVSAVFYAYIGFDAISTTAEECKNPQRDLPRGMMYSLIICTILYILIALVLTGMVNYKELNVPDPLAFVFKRPDLLWIRYLISISAVIATTTVLLVFQIGQPRIWMSMSRDGLLPPKFGSVHKRFKTPAFATIITGILVAIPSLLCPGSLMTDLTSIGTLFAFVLVCFGVLALPQLNAGDHQSRFHLTYINGRYIIPMLTLIFIVLFHNRLQESIVGLPAEGYQEILFLVFVLVSVVVSVLCFIHQYSVIPILGAMCCLYLMIEIPLISWFWFFIWMGVGLVLYFFYGMKHSTLKG